MSEGQERTKGEGRGRKRRWVSFVQVLKPNVFFYLLHLSLFTFLPPSGSLDFKISEANFSLASTMTFIQCVTINKHPKINLGPKS